MKHTVDTFAPVCLFVYNRLRHTQETVNALVANDLAKESDLVIYSDGTKTHDDPVRVNAVRDYLKTISGFKSIRIIEQPSNIGLAKSIIQGVTEVVNKYGKIIVLEDDIITAPQFLNFMNQALDYYGDDKRVWHISGWNYPIDINIREDVFFWRMMNCWGWATWQDRWQHFEKNPIRLQQSWTKKQIKAFNLDDAYDFWSHVLMNINGSLNTWAIFWYATIFENNGLELNPKVSLVHNIGFDGSGENCGTDDLYKGQVTGILPKITDIEVKESRIAKQAICQYYRAQKKNIFIRLISKCKKVINEYLPVMPVK